MRRYGWLGVMVLAGVGLPAQVVQAQVELKWKFKEGEKLYLETVTDSKQALVIAGKELRVDVKQTQVAGLLVKKKNSDGSVVIEYKFESIKVEGGGLAQILAKQVERMVGSVLTFTLSPNNTVSRVEGFKEMLEKIVADDPMAKQIAAAVSEDSIKQQMEMTFSFLPDKPVRVGDKWERKAVLSLGPIGGFNTQTNYQYDGKETVNGKPADKISSTSTLTYTPPKEDAVGAFPIKITKGDLKAETPKGAFWFDAAAGKLVQQKTTVKAAGTLTGTVMGMNFDVTLDQAEDTTVRLLEKSPVDR